MRRDRVPRVRVPAWGYARSTSTDWEKFYAAVRALGPRRSLLAPGTAALTPRQRLSRAQTFRRFLEREGLAAKGWRVRIVGAGVEVYR